MAHSRGTSPSSPQGSSMAAFAEDGSQFKKIENSKKRHETEMQKNTVQDVMTG